MKKYFEYKDEKSAKFWEIILNEKIVNTRYGKIGSVGQVSEKNLESLEKAEKEYHKLIKEKIDKGYVCIGDAAGDENKNANKSSHKLENGVLVPFKEAQEKYNLKFLPSYVVEQHEDNTILVFENDAHFESLDIDEFSATNSVDALLFCKNLIATHYIVQKEMDYGPTVIVLGDVKAKNVWCSGGNIYFKADVVVEQSFIAGVYNHGESTVSGDIQAELVFSEDHMFSYNTISKGIAVFDRRGEYKIQNYAVEDAFASKYLEHGEHPKLGTMFKAIKKGDSLLRSTKPNTPVQKQFEVSAKTGFSRLNLVALKLTEVPQDVFKHDNLIELILRNNYISVLPDDIAQLQALEKLDISYCDFETFPSVILKLKNLTSLNIAGCKFSQIPAEISQLKSLKELNIYNCRITEFPESIYELENLEILDVGYMEHLTKRISISKPLNSLKKLNMYSAFGASIEVALPKLIELNMRNCRLTKLPEHLFESLKLKKLDVSLNRNLKTFTEKLKNLKNLNELKFTASMTDIAEIQYLPKLKKLLVHFEHTPPQNFDDIYLNPHWTELSVETYMNDNVFWKKVLRRKNLKKLERVSSLCNEIIDIEQGRKELGVKI